MTPASGRRSGATLRAALSAALLSAAAAHAEEAREIETMLVTGSRLAESASAIPAHVTVIDRVALEASQARSVLDLLHLAAGVNVTQYGGRGGVSSVFVRGAEPNFTAVLIDGVRVNDPNNSRGGSFDFATLNLAEVERVEIARGTQSSIYGADALAGVINVITREAEAGRHAAIEGEIGEEGFYRTSLHASASIAPQTDVSLTGAIENDGDAIEGNDFDNRTIAGRVRNRTFEDWLFELSARYADTESESFPEDSGGPEYAVLREVDERDQSQLSVAGRARWTVSDRLALALEAGYLDHDEDYASPGIATGVLDGVPPYTSTSDLERGNAGLNATFSASSAIAMVVGVDYQDERGSQQGDIELFPGFSLPTDFDLDREILGVFAEVRAQSDGGLSAIASVRRDDPSENDSETTLRVGAQYAFGGTRIFGSYGEGYKLPSFFALGHALVGNPNLEPETSKTWEIGVSQSAFAGALDATFSAFASEYEDLIDFDFDLFTNVNRSKVDIQGIELAADVRPAEAVTLTAHLTYLDIDVHDSATTLRQRPDWSGGITARIDVSETLALTADWQSVGSFYDSSVPTGGITQDGYDRLDVEAAWQARERLKLWIAVDNAFDADYEEAVGFPAIGVRARLGFRYAL